jgi:hypothetical protein
MNQAAEQYHQRALAFHRANPSMVFVVRGGDHTRQVQSWFTYFYSRGQTGTISLFRQLLNGKGVVQFPCEWPELFDPSYVAPTHQWQAPEDRPQSRRDMSRVVDQTLHSLRNAVPRGRQPAPKDHLKEPELSPQEWLAQYRDDPPPIPVLSDEARAKMGLHQPRDEAAA